MLVGDSPQSSERAGMLGGTVNAQEPALLSASNLNNPVIVEDPDMIADQKVTWDCVWFGSYPQAEIVPSEEILLL